MRAQDQEGVVFGEGFEPVLDAAREHRVIEREPAFFDVEHGGFVAVFSDRVGDAVEEIVEDVAGDGGFAQKIGDVVALQVGPRIAVAGGVVFRECPTVRTLRKPGLETVREARREVNLEVGHRRAVFIGELRHTAQGGDDVAAVLAGHVVFVLEEDPLDPPREVADVFFELVAFAGEQREGIDGHTALALSEVVISALVQADVDHAAFVLVEDDDTRVGMIFTVLGNEEIHACGLTRAAGADDEGVAEGAIMEVEVVFGVGFVDEDGERPHRTPELGSEVFVETFAFVCPDPRAVVDEVVRGDRQPASAPTIAAWKGGDPVGEKMEAFAEMADEGGFMENADHVLSDRHQRFWILVEEVDR